MQRVPILFPSAALLLSAAVLDITAVQNARGLPHSQHEENVEVQMRGVNLRLANDVLLEIRSLRGQMERTEAKRPVTFDDPNSFIVQVASADIAMSSASLTRLLNSNVFAYPGAPLKNIAISFRGNRLVQKGTLHKGVDLPFEMESTVSVTPDGTVRLHAEKIRSGHVPIKGLLHFFGEDLARLVKVNAARGVSIEGDDILLAADRLIPSPHLRGRPAKAYIEGDKLVQVFASKPGEPPLQPPLKASAYIYHRGGVLRFGKLTMNDADLELVGDGRGPFEFCLPDYNRQLVAGYSKNTPSHGLIVHMPSYSQLRKPS